MRNKLLNTNQTNSISKGGVLYRPGEIPTLNKEQIAQANLVNKLPGNFPFANWESMNTKQQLQTMKYSGLNDQEQWSLLNTNVPLTVLNEHNQAQNQSESTAYVARAAANLVNTTSKAAVMPTQATTSKPTNSTSLQNNGLRQQLDKWIEGDKTKLLGKASGSTGAAVAPNATGKVTATVGSGLISPEGHKSGSEPASTPLKITLDTVPPTKTPKLTPSPSPTPTPLPQPGPTPIATPSVGNDSNPVGKSAPIDFSTRDKQILSSMLNMDRSLLSVSDRKEVEFIERQIQRGVTTPAQLGRFYADLLSIRARAVELEWVDDRKSESGKTATWGSELINNQKDYSSVPGSFGSKGNMKDNACGYMAINSANQFLGYHTDYSDTSHHLNNHSEFTTLADGQLGMNPLVVGAYYRSLGCQVKCFSNINVIPKTYDAYIMLYFYKSKDKNGNVTLGAHYIAVSYNPSTDKFTAYNNNNYGQIEQKDGFSQFLPPDQRGYFVWGINNPDQPLDTDPDPSGRNDKY